MGETSILAYCRDRGWPALLARNWARRGLRRWTSLQLAALQAGIDASTENWLVAAPTSAGKGLLAQVAALGRLFCGEKVLWLVPTRALAQALQSELTATLHPLGLRVAVSSGDHADPDGAIGENRWDLLIAVYEKGLQWLARNPDALAGVGLIVVDELGMLRDPERGGRLDLLLKMIDASPYTPRRLALCPDGPEVESFAAQLGCRLLVEHSRPRPLHEGILMADTGTFHWHDRDSGASGCEPIDTLDTWNSWLWRAGKAFDDRPVPLILAAIFAAIAIFTSRGEPSLLFAPTRAAARAWARALARLLGFDGDFRARARNRNHYCPINFAM